MSESIPVSARILVVDDDAGIRDLLSRYLREQGFAVEAVANGTEMDALLAARGVDLVILDLMLPGEDGLSLARRLRAADPALPIVMLSARGDDIDRIVGLEVGADDYLAKPFNPRELLARIRAVLRRKVTVPAANAGFAEAYRFGPFVLDLGQRSLRRDGEEIELPRAEFELLRVLVEHAGRPLSRDFILNAVGGEAHEAFDRSIDVRVTRLRRRIETDPTEPRYLQTVWGVGYRFVVDPGSGA